MDQKIQDKSTDFATHYRTVIHDTLKSTPYKPVMIMASSSAIEEDGPNPERLLHPYASNTTMSPKQQDRLRSYKAN